MVVGTVMLGVVLTACLLFPSLLISSSRLVGWQLTGFNGTGVDRPRFDPTTAQTTGVIPVYVASWPTEYSSTDDSWLSATITYTPWSVIITLHTSDAYESLIAGKIIGFYDTGGWVPVYLSEPLGGRALFDGSVFPPAARPYH